MSLYGPLIEKRYVPYGPPTYRKAGYVPYSPLYVFYGPLFPDTP